jgi:hypothetical protein
MFGLRYATTLLLLFAGLLSACDDGEPAGPCVCTEEFRSYWLDVREIDGGPAEGVQVSVVRESNGQKLGYGTPVFEPGTYLIMDDGFTEQIARDEGFQVDGERGAATFQASFRFGTDACRCHVIKIDGPESVTLSPD